MSYNEDKSELFNILYVLHYTHLYTLTAHTHAISETTK